MRTTPITKPIFSIRLMKDKIDPKPQYQRGPVWSDQKKQLLIDTILRNYDIPKFYFRIVDDTKYDYEVVDGQQRLRAIWDFLEDQYHLGDYSKDIDDFEDLSGLRFSEIPTDAQERVLGYTLSITELHNSNDIEVRELFLRLQEGSTLTPPEKRNAMIGNMRDFISSISKKPIFLKTTTKNDRFQHDDWAAHITAIELASGATDVKAADLKKLYEKNSDFEENGKKGKKINRVLNFMDKAFSGNTPELNIKWGFVDLYLLISSIIDQYNISSSHEDVVNFYLSFENDRRSVSDPADLISNGHSDWQKDLYLYIEAFQREGAKRANIQKRADVYLRRFLHDFPDLKIKDPNRLFTENERIVIWRRAGGKCENPDCSVALSLDEMRADHLEAHSKGGRTTLENAQCLCKSCNSKKGDN